MLAFLRLIWSLQAKHIAGCTRTRRITRSLRKRNSTQFLLLTAELCYIRQKLTDVVDKPGLRVEIAIAGFVHAVEVVVVKGPLLGPFWGLQDLLCRNLPASRNVGYSLHIGQIDPHHTIWKLRGR